jgi:putative FmdB family regulatory protein
MPTYAYACTSCGHQFDAVQSFSDNALTECPECGGTLRKQYGSIGVTFNGSGFYRTDSRAKSSGSTDASASSKTEKTTSPQPAAASTPSSN